MDYLTLLFAALLFSLSSSASSSAETTSVESNLKEELFRQTSAGHTPHSYRTARVKMFNDVHLEKDSNGYFVEGVYCLDKYYRSGRDIPTDRIPDHTSFNTEHTWPQSKFSGRFSRRAQKTDLHHLFPTFSRINSQRSNYPFAEVQRERDMFCESAQAGSPANGGGGIYFEPPNEHKGNVARAMFYFSVRYKISIDPLQETFLRLWHWEDPVDDKERKRNERVFEFQGNKNPFIDRPELVSRIRDF